MSELNRDETDLAAVLGPTEAAAAEWVHRQERGLTLLEEEELADWLAADPEHERVFLEMQETAQLLDGAGESLWMPAAKEVHEKPVVIRPRWQVFARASLAAAALLAIVALGWQQFGPATDVRAQTVVTQVGEMRKLELADGSVVLLNTDTAVEVRYRDHERRVDLVRGEAFFTVAKDPVRPFLVHAGPVSVRAVGTAFNVRFQTEAVKVLVTEGTVRVVEDSARKPAVEESTEDQGPFVTVGKMAQVNLEPAGTRPASAVTISAAEPKAIQSALAWQSGRLEFFETSLAEVVAEFNRYNQRRIVIADTELASQRFGGAFNSHEVEPLLELLEQSFGVIVEERGNETVIRRAR